MLIVSIIQDFATPSGNTPAIVPRVTSIRLTFLYSNTGHGMFSDTAKLTYLWKLSPQIDRGETRALQCRYPCLAALCTCPGREWRVGYPFSIEDFSYYIRGARAISLKRGKFRVFSSCFNSHARDRFGTIESQFTDKALSLLGLQALRSSARGGQSGA